MSTTKNYLTSIALTQNDINLITFALRKLSEDAKFTGIVNDSKDLIK